MRKRVVGLIVANSLEFELYCISDIEPLEPTEENYNKGTMSFRMGASYLKQTSGEENAKIEQSKNWSGKMKGEQSHGKQHI